MSRLRLDSAPAAKLARALSDAALALQSEHDPMRILGVMAEQMGRVVPVTEMAIFVADYETFRLVPVLATGPDRDEIMADSMALDAGITGWAFAKGTPQNIPDTSQHPLARQIPGTSYVQESLLLVPLVATEHKLGIINCWRLGSDQFSASELEAASLFAHVAASAWRNAQLYGELVNAAMTDPLTGLYNSRWLRDAGERDIARAARDGKPLSLLLVDLDHFKAVNDSSGHAIGDVVLQRVAAQLRTTVRGADAVVRLGGEEFVVLLNECSADGAWIAAEAVRTRGSRCRDAGGRHPRGTHGVNRHRHVSRPRRHARSVARCGRPRDVLREARGPGSLGERDPVPGAGPDHHAPAPPATTSERAAGRLRDAEVASGDVAADREDPAGGGEEQAPAEQDETAFERGER